MTKRLVRMAHCYRCNHKWRMRRRVPSFCPRCKSKLYRTARSPSRAAIRRLYRRFNLLPEPNWEANGPVRIDLRRRRAKDEILVRHGMRPSILYESQGIRAHPH